MQSIPLLHYIKNSIFFRVIFIGIVILILQVPISMIDSQISERQNTKNLAVNDITSKWGKKQIVISPRIVVPYTESTEWINSNNKPHTQRKKKFITFLPEALKINAKTVNETRNRGLFEVPLYKSLIVISGVFNNQVLDKWGIKPELIHWDQAEIVMGISDVRAIQKQVNIIWNGNSIAFEPGMGTFCVKNQSGLHAQLPLVRHSEKYKFKLTLELNGSDGLFFSPMGKNSEIDIISDWPHPSFQGYKLPSQRVVRDDGFSAKWMVSHISRNFPQQWLDGRRDQQLHQSIIGVDFILPVDSYRMTERSSKYVVLFLLLTFTVIWLIEVLTNIRVHVLQYLFIGLSMCMFYLLLLAFSEHIGFLWAYFIASSSVIVLCSGYARTILKTKRNSIIVGASISTLYLYLFTLLHEQNYSLLLGSTGVLIGLAVVMYSTRNIDWFNIVDTKNGSDNE